VSYNSQKKLACPAHSNVPATLKMVAPLLLPMTLDPQLANQYPKYAIDFGVLPNLGMVPIKTMVPSIQNL